MTAPPGAAALAALFLVSGAALAYEIALTRFFAVAKWSEYGYWVISIAMAGFAFGGVALALWRRAMAARAAGLAPALVLALLAAAAAGYTLAILNPFNPLQLQNPVTWQGQLWHIGAYYACLLPVFFLAGLFIGLMFVRFPRSPGAVYGCDLLGAGCGAGAVLALMGLIAPFRLVTAILPAIALAAPLAAPRGQARRASAIAALVLLAAGEGLLLAGPQAGFDQWKPIYAPLHTQGAHILAEVRAPRGDYLLLDDFTERVDTDISNDTGLLHVPGPPRAFGLYRDGNRIGALARPDGLTARYAPAALDGGPYALLHDPRVLLAGTSGGFRIVEARALGAGRIVADEPEPVMLASLRHGMGPSPALPAIDRLHLTGAPPLALLADAAGEGGRYDLIDISADFLDAGRANVGLFTVQGLRLALAALRPGGIVSVPVSIRDFPVYALRMLVTARDALLADGVRNPGRHVLVYRSAWSVRILIARQAFATPAIAALRKFCDDRSFDVSWYPGIDITALRANLYNDLPAISFAAGEVSANGPDDSIADEAGAVLTGQPSVSALAFDLRPVTLSRPFFYAVLRLDQLGTLLRRLEILPQQEIGAMVNLAVLAQAALIAVFVLALPGLAPGRLGVRGNGAGLARALVFFPALGLGYLFLEIYLIQQATFLLNDATAGFALVLTAMLLCSGVGAMASGWVVACAGRTMAAVAGMLVIAAVLLVAGGPGVIVAALGLPPWLRVMTFLLALAPLALAMGLPFPLGLGRISVGAPALSPWAWGLNGAFSVVATPLADLIARQAGFDRVLLLAAMLYVLAALALPPAPIERLRKT